MKIEIRNVRKSFGKIELFHDYSAEIPSGKMTGIYGESGAGKTTLLNMIGMIEPYDGTITYDGKEVKTRKERNRMLAERIGFVFQNFGLVDDLTVEENIRLMKCMKRKEKREQIPAVLKKLGLEGRENSIVYELSGGEQQRVAIAKVLLKNADLILADEPTASLDERNKEFVMRLLRNCVDGGKTVVIVTHDKEIIKQCDVIIHLKKDNNRGDI